MPSTEYPKNCGHDPEEFLVLRSFILLRAPCGFPLSHCPEYFATPLKHSSSYDTSECTVCVIFPIPAGAPSTHSPEYIASSLTLRSEIIPFPDGFPLIDGPEYLEPSGSR